jgi:hypothetical protein
LFDRFDSTLFREPYFLAAGCVRDQLDADMEQRCEIITV